MDIDLLRTFLEVYRTRHFGRASRTLFITQSAISTRIKQLEESLKVELFTRKRNDIQLTQAGKRFLPAAEALLKMWEEARKTVLIEELLQPRLSVGAPATLWAVILPAWVARLRQESASMTLGGVTSSQEALFSGLLDGLLDVAFLLDPPANKALQMQEIQSVELVMVASHPGQRVGESLLESSQHYILVEWDQPFLQEHACWFPRSFVPFMQTDQPRLAHELLLNGGGRAYLARHQVEADLEAGRLFVVEEAMVCKRMVYALYAESGQNRARVEAALSLWPGTVGQPGSFC